VCAANTSKGKENFVRNTTTIKNFITHSAATTKIIEMRINGKSYKNYFFIPPFSIDQLRNSNMVSEHLKSMKEKIRESQGAMK
jgi:hypothetical protein